MGGQGRGGSLKSGYAGTSLAVQWLRLCASTVAGMGSIPGQGTKIPRAMHVHGQKTNKQKIWLC